MGKPNYFRHTCTIIAFVCDIGAVWGFIRVLMSGIVPFERSWSWFGSLSPADAMHLYAMAFAGLSLFMIILNWNVYISLRDKVREKSAADLKILLEAAERLAAAYYVKSSPKTQDDFLRRARCEADIRLIQSKGLAPLNTESPAIDIVYWVELLARLKVGYAEARRWHGKYHKYGVQH